MIESLLARRRRPSVVLEAVRDLEDRADKAIARRDEVAAEYRAADRAIASRHRR